MSIYFAIFWHMLHVTSTSSINGMSFKQTIIMCLMHIRYLLVLITPLDCIVLYINQCIQSFTPFYDLWEIRSPDILWKMLKKEKNAITWIWTTLSCMIGRHTPTWPPSSRNETFFILNVVDRGWNLGNS